MSALPPGSTRSPDRRNGGAPVGRDATQLSKSSRRSLGSSGGAFHRVGATSSSPAASRHQRKSAGSDAIVTTLNEPLSMEAVGVKIRIGETVTSADGACHESAAVDTGLDQVPMSPRAMNKLDWIVQWGCKVSEEHPSTQPDTTPSQARSKATSHRKSSFGTSERVLSPLSPSESPRGTNPRDGGEGSARSPSSTVRHITSGSSRASAAGGLTLAQQICARGTLNCEIPADLESLELIHSHFGWTPSAGMVRPTVEVQRDKEKHVMSTLRKYRSLSDQVLYEVFGCPITPQADGKQIAIVSEAIWGRKRLARHPFPYKLPRGTRHHVMWYVAQNIPVSRETMTEDIAHGIELLIGSHNEYEFAFYENPMMTIPDLYHVQVFWRKLPRLQTRGARS
eukprot:m.380278 g.380278  ORF g.380278 m.380278 type:complete len:395 (-) comp16711_c0_seq37:416-1600(-)